MSRLRLLLLPCGLAFAVTLAVMVGQRLSAEAMAVLVGVLAGVAASVPTSLIVVWLATRSLRTAAVAPLEAPLPAEAPEPRVIYVTPQSMAAAAAAYQTLTGYAVPAQAVPAAPAQPPAGFLAPRQFTVIGGLEPQLDGSETPTEVIWPR